ncbi:MAG: hypothetical protein Q7T81_08835 [Pseudolabrys sp.]|nr:hypothetical protein [Pseudolabrys sp.]
MMSTTNKTIDASEINETAFERGDDVALTASLASLSWFALALLIFLVPHGFTGVWFYSAAAAFAVVGCAIAAVELASSWSPLARRWLRASPWLLAFAVLLDVWLALSYLRQSAGW